MCQCNPNIRTPWCRACKGKKFGIKEATSMSVVSENGEVLMDLNIPKQQESTKKKEEPNKENLNKFKMNASGESFVIYMDDENYEKMKKLSENTKFKTLDV